MEDHKLISDGSQRTGDVSQKPGSRLSLLSNRPVVISRARRHHCPKVKLSGCHWGLKAAMLSVPGSVSYTHLTLPTKRIV